MSVIIASWPPSNERILPELRSSLWDWLVYVLVMICDVLLPRRRSGGVGKIRARALRLIIDGFLNLTEILQQIFISGLRCNTTGLMFMRVSVLHSDISPWKKRVKRIHILIGLYNCWVKFIRSRRVLTKNSEYSSHQGPDGCCHSFWLHGLHICSIYWWVGTWRPAPPVDLLLSLFWALTAIRSRNSYRRSDMLRWFLSGSCHIH